MNNPSLKVLFVAGFGPIVSNAAASKSFYSNVLHLPLQQREGNPDYLHTEELEGVRHFALWPLEEAALSCFGRDTWPASVPAPHAWLEFDVEDVAAATAELKHRATHCSWMHAQSHGVR